MKRLTVPVVMCVLMATGSVAACLGIEFDEEDGKPAESKQTIEQRILALEKQITELQTESSRQAAVIRSQAEIIRKLEQRPVTGPEYRPVHVPRQQPLPYDTLPRTVPPDPQHPSASVPGFPKGTVQRWINGMPYYLVPCETGVPVAQWKTAPVFRHALVGAVVLPSEARSRQRWPHSVAPPAQTSP